MVANSVTVLLRRALWYECVALYAILQSLGNHTCAATATQFVEKMSYMLMLTLMLFNTHCTTVGQQHSRSTIRGAAYTSVPVHT
eukprot:16957-Heterococcus_DN1.PRE.2